MPYWFVGLLHRYGHVWLRLHVAQSNWRDDKRGCNVYWLIITILISTYTKVPNANVVVSQFPCGAGSRCSNWCTVTMLYAYYTGIPYSSCCFFSKSTLTYMTFSCYRLITRLIIPLLFNPLLKNNSFFMTVIVCVCRIDHGKVVLGHTLPLVLKKWWDGLIPAKAYSQALN